MNVRQWFFDPGNALPVRHKINTTVSTQHPISVSLLKPPRRLQSDFDISRSLLPAICCLLPFLVTGCSSSGVSADVSSMNGTRDNTPQVLSPMSPGSDTRGTADAVLDFSNQKDGYFSASYSGSSDKVKLQVTTSDGITYTYNLPTDGTSAVFPFSDGDGSYDIGIYTNIEGTRYATEFQTEVSVELDDEFLPFLYPNQYVWFNEDTQAVAKAAEIVEPADTDLDAVTLIYDFVVDTLSYDWDEAETVENGYLPDVDEVLETQKGICLDYSALMACMLRSQRIPTRMEIGYSGTTYHAWISTYIEDVGWVNGIIQFDGTDWSLMDPTLASTEGAQKVKKYISNENQYRVCYEY